MGGPFCCGPNVKVAFYLGIIFVILGILNCFGEDEKGERLTNIIGGVVGALINGLLVYGANARNSTAILVWMVLAVIECILVCVFAVLLVIAIILKLVCTIPIILVQCSSEGLPIRFVH